MTRKTPTPAPTPTTATAPARCRTRRTAIRCYHRRKEAGLCVTCGTVAPELGRTW